MGIAEQLSWAIAFAAVLLAGLTIVVLRRPSLGLAVLLDLLLAAGLLRLDADESWPVIAVTAAVIALRHLLARGLGMSRVLSFVPRDAVAVRPWAARQRRVSE